MSAEVWAAHVRASGVHLPDRIQVSPVHLKVVHRPEGCFMEGLLFDASLYIIQFAKVASLHPYGVVRSRESSPSVKLRSPRGGTPDFGVQVSLVNLIDPHVSPPTTRLRPPPPQGEPQSTLEAYVNPNLCGILPALFDDNIFK